MNVVGGTLLASSALRSEVGDSWTLVCMLHDPRRRQLARDARARHTATVAMGSNRQRLLTTGPVLEGDVGDGGCAPGAFAGEKGFLGRS